MYPERMEVKAPMRNATVVKGNSASLGSAVKKIKVANRAMKIKR